MLWTVINHDAFDPEFDALPGAVRIALLAATGLLEIHGPTLGRCGSTWPVSPRPGSTKI